MSGRQPSSMNAVGERSPPAWAVWSGLAAVYVVWGSTYLAIRYAVETMPPFLMAGTRFLLAGGILYGLRGARGDSRPDLRQWREAAIVGVFLLVGGNGAISWAAQFVPSAVVALLVASVPFWMVLMDLGRARGSPSAAAWLGLVAGFIGVALLVNPAAGAAWDPPALRGMAVVLAASLSWAFGSLYSRSARLPPSSLLATAMEMIAGGAALLVLGSLLGEWSELEGGRIAPRSLAAQFYLIVFGSWAGFATYRWLLRVAPASLVATYAYVNPVVAVVLGYFVGQEPLTTRTLVAAAIIVAAVALVSARRS